MSEHPTSRIERLQELRDLLESNPGLRAAELASLLHVPQSTVARDLPDANEAGILLQEDDHGHLSLFRYDDEEDLERF